MSYTPKQDSDVDCLHWHALNYRTAGLDAQSAWVELEAFFDKQIKEAYQAGRASRDAEVEALRADAERGQWMAKRDRWASCLIDFDRTSTYDKHRVVWFADDGWHEAQGQSFEEAIDAAMSAQEKQA